MIKKMSLRKISVSTMALIIFGLFYFFPTNKDEIKLNQAINYYDESDYKSVYLMDKYNYVSKLNVIIEKAEIYEIIKEKLEYLTIGGSQINNIPNGFRPIIPIDTKVLDVKLEEKNAVINFSKEILNVKLEDEEHMIEAIVFTLTESSEIKSVTILVEGEILTELPNSKKTIPKILDRSYGINKIYDFDTLSGITKTIIYYVNKINDDIYYTPVTKINNDTRDKVTIVIEELKSSVIYQSNLSSYLNANVELNDYEIIEDSIILSFNDSIFDNNSKNILESVEYSISMSLMDNLDVEEVVFSVNNEKISTTTSKTLE